MAKDQKRLGRSISAIFPSDAPLNRVNEEASPISPILGPVRGLPQSSRLGNIPVDAIHANPMQPRRSFDEQALGSLAASMRDRGTLQPIVVRPSDGGYELVAGERRLRAAKLAGLRDIPAIIRATSEDELLELALVENIQRADLNPVDRARAYRLLHETYGLSHEEIARRMGEDRATVTNYIRLLGLPPPILDLVTTGSLTLGHAKAVLGVQDSIYQTELADRAVREHWSVRQLERAAARGRTDRSAAPGGRQPRAAVKDIQERLSASLGTRVQIREGRRRHTGKIIIEYYSLDDFHRVTSRLGLTDEAT